MKKLITLLVLCFVVLSVADDVIKDKMNRTNRTARKMYLGFVLDALMDIGRGGKVLASSPNFIAGESDTAKVKHAAFNAWNSGSYIQFPALETAFTATTHDVDSSKYATYRLGKDFDDSTVVVIMSAADYATKDSALAAIPACPDTLLNLGHLTVYASGALFNATTTKLNASTVSVEYWDAVNFLYDLESWSAWNDSLAVSEKP